MKFGQIIEYNITNIFFVKELYTKKRWKSSPKHFSIKSKLSISLDEPSEILNSLYLLCAQAEDYQSTC